MLKIRHNGEYTAVYGCLDLKPLQPFKRAEIKLGKQEKIKRNNLSIGLKRNNTKLIMSLIYI